MKKLEVRDLPLVTLSGDLCGAAFADVMIDKICRDVELVRNVEHGVSPPSTTKHQWQPHDEGVQPQPPEPEEASPADDLPSPA